MAPKDKPLRSQRDVLDALTRAYQEGDQGEIARLRVLLADHTAAMEAGEAGDVDPRAASLPLLTDDQLEELARAAREYAEVRRAIDDLIDASRDEDHDPDRLKMTIPTWRLYAQRTIGEGHAIFSVDHLRKRSTPKATLAGLLAAVGVDARACRVTLCAPRVPRDPLDPGPDEAWYREHSIAYPESEADWQEVDDRYRGSVPAWSRDKQIALVMGYASSHGLIPVPGEPASPIGFVGERWTLNMVDAAFALDACPNGLAELHYLKDLFSQIDVDGAIPHWRRADYVAVDPEVYTQITEVLGLGVAFDEDRPSPTITDGRSIYFPGDGGPLPFPGLRDADREAIAARARRLAELDFQFRAAAVSIRKTGTFRDFLRGRRATRRGMDWLAKGTVSPFDRRAARVLLERFRAHLRALHVGGESDLAFAKEARYREGVRVLERALRSEGDFFVFVAGDQIKVGAHRARSGRAYVAGTWLKGKPEAKGRVPLALTAGQAAPLARELARTTDALEHRVAEAVAYGRRARHRAEQAGVVLGEPTGYYRAEVEFEDGPPGRYEGPVFGGPVSVRGPEETVRMKPAQFRPSGNPQYTQLLSPAAVPDLQAFVERVTRRVARALTTPAGAARLRDEATAHLRERLEASYAAEEAPWLVDPAETRPIEAELGQMDTLGEALLTPLVRLDAAGYEQLYAAGQVDYGHLHMLETHRNQVEALAAAAYSRILRAQGLERHYGYLGWTVEDSRSLHQRLGFPGWTRAASRDEAAGRLAIGEAVPHGLLDPSSAAFPERVVRPLNGDDDGDILQVVAAVVDVSGRVRYVRFEARPGRRTRRITGLRVRMMKVEIFGRYPLVDAPVLRVVPVGDRSLGDAATREEEADFAEFVSIFRPRVPEGADPFGEATVIASSTRLLRLADKGAKETIVKRKRSGKITLRSAMDVVLAKLARNRTGWMTRRQEQLTVLLGIERLKADHERRTHGRILPTTASRLAAYKRRVARMATVLEMELTGFKYVMAADLDVPYLDLGRDDLFTHQQYKELIPLSYHGVASRIGSALAASNKNQRGPGTVSIEGLLVDRPKGAEPIPGWGAGTLVANHAIKTSGDELIGAVEAIRTDTDAYARALMKRRAEMGPYDEEEVRRVLLALHNWNAVWRATREETEEAAALADDYEEAGIDTEAVRLREGIEERLSATSGALRAYLIRVAGGVSLPSLVEGLARRYEEKEAAAAEAEDRAGAIAANPRSSHEQMEAARRFAEAKQAAVDNVAAELTLLTGRLFEVFGAASADVRYRSVRGERYDHALRVFTTGQDLPGEQGGIAPLRSIHVAPEDADAAGERVVTFVATGRDGTLYPLYLATGEDRHREEGAMPAATTEVVLIKATPRSGVLLWKRDAPRARPEA